MLVGTKLGVETGQGELDVVVGAQTEGEEVVVDLLEPFGALGVLPDPFGEPRPQFFELGASSLGGLVVTFVDRLIALADRTLHDD
ncbi:hypothetical protein FOF52_06520 [Thermobifida alba]|uniref:Uncharacterized protein n=1 Tax=Thermobifida alba TaxID=53522 RepID=A0ABY4L151_THEAE|nr:hypothetical protein [Thermobifida alba]UPT20661.1 hypothetical protein FOF52_06520 [Thermobifida alba]